MKKIRTSKETQKIINLRKVAKLDVGCGANKQGKDWVGMDYRAMDGVDIVWDIGKFPWPIADETFDLAATSHVLEHINPMPVDPRITGLAQMLLDKKLVSQKDIDKYVGEIAPGPVFMRFMDEVWRILKVGGEFLCAFPYAGSPGFWQDPTHINAINETTFDYFDPKGPFSNGGLWSIYKPKPWYLKINTWHVVGNMEVVLTKRAFNKDNKY